MHPVDNIAEILKCIMEEQNFRSDLGRLVHKLQLKF